MAKTNSLTFTIATAAWIVISLGFATPDSFAMGPDGNSGTTENSGTSGKRLVADATRKPKPRRQPSQNPVVSAKGKGPAMSAKEKGIVADRRTESAALRLVQTHLTELEGVLERLRSNDTKQYQRAIIDLARSARKLDAAKKRDERLFQIEVEILKAQSGANLLTAKLKVRDSAADRKSLRTAVRRLQQAKLSRARYDLDALRLRMERTQRQLQTAQDRVASNQQGAADQLEKAYAGFLRKAGRKTDPLSDDAESSPRGKLKSTSKKRKQ